MRDWVRPVSTRASAQASRRYPTRPNRTSPDRLSLTTARSASASSRSTAGASAGSQDSNAAAAPAPSAPSSRSGAGAKPVLPIDLKRTLDQLLGHVPGLPKVPGLPQPPPSVTNQVPNAPLSKQDTQALLNYLLAP